MAGLTTENLYYKVDRYIRDVTSGVLGTNLTLQQILMQSTRSFYYLVDAAAGAAYTWGLFKAEFDCKLLAARFVPHGTVTAHDTNYATLTIEVGSTVKATMLPTKITGGTGNWVLNTPVDFGTINDSLISAGDVVEVAKAYAGSGVAIPAGFVQLFIVPR